VVTNTNNAHVSLVMNSKIFAKHMTVYIKCDIDIQYMYMIQSNNYSSTAWFTQDITISQQDWRCPEGLVVQCRCPAIARYHYNTIGMIEFNLGWPTPLMMSVL
jgi:hypothetical protein